MSAGHNFITSEASTSFDSVLSTSLSEKRTQTNEVALWQMKWLRQWSVPDGTMKLPFGQTEITKLFTLKREVILDTIIPTNKNLTKWFSLHWKKSRQMRSVCLRRGNLLTLNCILSKVCGHIMRSKPYFVDKQRKLNKLLIFWSNGDKLKAPHKKFNIAPILSEVGFYIGKNAGSLFAYSFGWWELCVAIMELCVFRA